MLLYKPNLLWTEGGRSHGVMGIALALAGSDPHITHTFMCDLATSKPVLERVRWVSGPRGWGWDLLCHVNVVFSRKCPWVDDGTDILESLLTFFFFFKAVTCNALMKEERPCTRQVLALDANQPLLEVLLLQINHATACITMCDCPHPSTPLSCLQHWLHLTVFVKFMLGLALNVSHSGKPNDCFIDASIFFVFWDKAMAHRGCGCYSTSDVLPIFPFACVCSRMAESSSESLNAVWISEKSHS